MNIERFILKLFIKYMENASCKIAVEGIIAKMGLHCETVDLGEVDVIEDISRKKRDILKTALLNSGFELINSKPSLLIVKIRNTVLDTVNHSQEPLKINFSLYLSNKLNHDYTYMANLFSAVHGMTLQQYMISHKVERIKSLILFNELSITQIAWKLNYSSVAYMCNQFKKVTGLSTTNFKELKFSDRKVKDNPDHRIM